MCGDCTGLGSTCAEYNLWQSFHISTPPVSLFATARGGKTGMGADESQRLHTKPFLQQWHLGDKKIPIIVL